LPFHFTRNALNSLTNTVDRKDRKILHFSHLRFIRKFFIWVIGLFNVGTIHSDFFQSIFSLIFFVANISFNAVNCDKRDQRDFDKIFKKKKNVFDKEYEQARHKTFFHPKLILFSFKAFQKQNYSNLNSALIC